MVMLGLPIPETARMILLQQTKFKQYRDKLLYIVRLYDNAVAQVPLFLRPIIAPLLADVDKMIAPAHTSMTWLSLNIDPFLFSALQSLNQLNDLLTRINGDFLQRINAVVDAIGQPLTGYAVALPSRCEDLTALMGKLATARLTTVANRSEEALLLSVMLSQQCRPMRPLV